MYFVTEYCEQENTLLNEYKQLKMILSHFKKRFYGEYILPLRERHQDEAKKTNNHSILKVKDIVSLKEDKPRIKWRKVKIKKLLYGNDNLIRGAELLATQKLKGKIVKIIRLLQTIVLLELRNDFNDNSDNNNVNNNNDDENDNVNSDSLNPRDNLDDLLDKTGLREKRKPKRVVAINADIVRGSNDENVK